MEKKGNTCLQVWLLGVQAALPVADALVFVLIRSEGARAGTRGERNLLFCRGYFNSAGKSHFEGLRVCGNSRRSAQSSVLAKIAKFCSEWAWAWSVGYIAPPVLNSVFVATLQISMVLH